MNVTEKCGINNCNNDAELVVVDKSAGRVQYICRRHVGIIISPLNTYSVFPIWAYLTKPIPEGAPNLRVQSSCASCNYSMWKDGRPACVKHPTEYIGESWSEAHQLFCDNYFNSLSQSIQVMPPITPVINNEQKPPVIKNEQKPPEPIEVTAWLIELFNSDGGNSTGFALNIGGTPCHIDQWVSFDAATRFSRRRDGEAYLKRHTPVINGVCRVTEHTWF